MHIIIQGHAIDLQKVSAITPCKKGNLACCGESKFQIWLDGLRSIDVSTNSFEERYLINQDRSLTSSQNKEKKLLIIDSHLKKIEALREKLIYLWMQPTNTRPLILDL